MNKQRVIREFDKLFMERIRTPWDQLIKRELIDLLDTVGIHDNQIITISTDSIGNKCLQIDWTVGELKYKVGERVKFKPHGEFGIIRDIDPVITPHSRNYFIDFGGIGPHCIWVHEDDLEVVK